MPGREDYEERKERRKEMYENRIIKAKENSRNYYDRHNEIASRIPMRTTYHTRTS